MKWDKLKEFLHSKYAKPAFFFGFYLIFFTVLFAAARGGSSDYTNESPKDVWSNISNNYEYLYEIQTNDNQLISLEGKRYNNKNLFTKKINDEKINDVYIFYNDVLIKKDNTWINDSNFVLVNNNFDNNYLDITYIKRLVSDAELIDTKTNFDGSKSEDYLFGDISLRVTSENDTLKKIEILRPLYKLTLQYKNINQVLDFVVEK